jgi:hypothetical protein
VWDEARRWIDGNVEWLGKRDKVALAPTIDLFRIRGAEMTNEYVLLHEPSRYMACTDLFHGPYSDYDPLNTWMCRIFFKLTRRGHYKSATILPSFREYEIAHNGSMDAVRRSIEELIAWRGSGFEGILFSHGTPPIVKYAKEALMAQYGMASFDENFLNDQVPQADRESKKNAWIHDLAKEAKPAEE